MTCEEAVRKLQNVVDNALRLQKDLVPAALEIDRLLCDVRSIKEYVQATKHLEVHVDSRIYNNTVPVTLLNAYHNLPEWAKQESL